MPASNMRAVLWVLRVQNCVSLRKWNLAKIRRFRRSKGAVSTVVATIMLVNTAVAMGAIMFAWSSGMLSAYRSDTEVQYSLIGEKTREAIAVENVWFQNGGQKKITVFVRNVGLCEAKLVSIYVSGSPYLPNGTWPYTLVVGSRVSLQVICNWIANSTYQITVGTTRGNQARSQWVA